MKRLTALAFVTLVVISALVVAFPQPVSALSEESSLVTQSGVFQVGNETEPQEVKNMLIVAIGGVVAVVLFLAIILLRVLRKRKRTI